MTQPIVWCVGGIDPSGGAGITRDVTTFADLGIHACVITTLTTAQSNTVMLRSHATSVCELKAQWQVLADEAFPQAIKIGAIANDEQACLLCDYIELLPNPRPFIVWDPVLHSTSGGKLGQLSRAVTQRLIQIADLITPNTSELVMLTGMQVNTDDAKRNAMAHLLAMGAEAVFAKGGHANWQSKAVDTFMSAFHEYEFVQPRNTHGKLRGTGCMQASAIAAFMVNGYCMEDALTLANAYLKQVRDISVGDVAGKLPSRTGSVYAAKNVGFPVKPDVYPRVYIGSNDPVKQAGKLEFPRLTNAALGIYPVVDDVSLIATLLPTGVKIIQLRLKQEGKGASTQEISTQIKQAVTLTKGTHCQLFINDHWQLAIEHGAYGVHLGQEDLANADLEALSAAGVRLGISTHGYAELQRVKMLNPSYIALGHIFATKTKAMPSQPQGLSRLKHYVALCANTPTVAIGGINKRRAKAVADTGVSSIAVVTAITNADDPVAAYHSLIGEAGFAE